MIKRTIFLVLLSVTLIGCATLRAEPTVGQQFRKVMADIDALCKKEKLGPYLDPIDPDYKDKRKQQGTCDILTLKPYDPLATPEGRFAHSLKLPPPHDQPKNVWRDGMTGEEYFKALCEAEAGEWVFRKAEGVEGIMQLRLSPRSEPSPMNIVLLEAPGTVSPPAESYMSFLPPLGSFRYLEVVEGQNSSVERFIYKGTYRKGSILTRQHYDQQTIKNPDSRFAITWRGISRPNDREHGIVGGELLVLDKTTNEIIGFKRDFIRFYFDPNYKDSRILWPRRCKVHGKDDTNELLKNYPEQEAYEFVRTVIVPPN